MRQRVNSALTGQEWWTMQTAALESVALLAIRGQRLGLILPPQSAWRDLYGVRATRLELPGAPHVAGADPQREALALGEAYVGRHITPLPTRWTYGPSPRHAVDRYPLTETSRTAPFLRLERILPAEPETGEPETGEPPHAITVEVYRAIVRDDAMLNGERVGALLWLPVGALRQVVGGMPLGDLLAMEDVRAEYPAGETSAPEEALIYLPSEYGERYLLRIVAKYGEDALFAAPAATS